MDMTMLASVLRHDRTIIMILLLGVMTGSLAYLLAGMDAPMPEMDGMAMPAPAWTTGHFAMMLAMWLAMMSVMMLPSAVPMLLFYDSIARKHGVGSAAVGHTVLFGAGYLAVWLVFSAGAVILQFALDKGSLLSPAMRITSVTLAGASLVAAGVYQWTPLKQACLRQCRSPLDFVLTHWRNGSGGAFSMGLRHGVFCLGCCWMLMLLLFVGGVMDFRWIAGIALFVLIEKLAPAGHWAGKATGALLVAWGATVLTSLASAV
jgi:predicted metal-binding membrane protein